MGIKFVSPCVIVTGITTIKLASNHVCAIIYLTACSFSKDLTIV